jgi:hypothetical protein
MHKQLGHSGRCANPLGAATPPPAGVNFCPRG